MKRTTEIILVICLDGGCVTRRRESAALGCQLMEPVINVSNLKKTYPDGTEAVKGISFEVQRGELFGLLGPNGAGKTTTIRMLITLIDKSGGEAEVLGYDINREADKIRRCIGYAAQETGIDDDLTGRENLTLQGRLYHIPPDKLKQRVADLLQLMDLTLDADRSAGAYSGGMRKRLDLATALIHDPQVLFLDEPTTGLDPQTRANLWEYLERLNQEEELTILLTTHYMEEADRLCDRVAIIDKGRIVADDTPTHLKTELGGDVITLTFKANKLPLEEQKMRAAETLRSLTCVHEVRPFEEGVSVIVDDGAAAVPQVLHALDRTGIAATRLSLTSPTLDDVFLKYTGYSIRQEDLNVHWRSSRSGPGAARRRPR
jgi:ABC-2 type transport system ATP-binding protein